MDTESVGRPLVGTSIDLIVQSQASTGAYVAAPGYDTYAYSWLRDGAFIAAAMDACGRHDSAAAFHAWVARTVERHAHKVELLEAESTEALQGTGDPLHPLDRRYTLHTRFTIDGGETDGHWGEFQLDGYGFWLSSVARHVALTRCDPEPYAKAIDLVCRYLALTWELPCFDSWEEYPTRRHMTTWAAVAKGLHEAGRLEVGTNGSATVEEIRRRLADASRPGHFLRKFVPEADGGKSSEGVAGSKVRPEIAVAGHERIGRALDPDAVDGSALLVLGAFGPFEPTDGTVSGTLGAIEDALVVDGGVHRYLEDEYYGGGVWVVLGGALSALFASRDPRRASDILEWIEAQADSSGHLPEQVATRVRKPESRAAWIDRWGPPARPLLWSHAMYLLGAAALHPLA